MSRDKNKTYFDIDNEGKIRLHIIPERVILLFSN